MSFTGVYNDPGCKESCVIDHGVLLVGYGVEDNKNHWLVKNSWGEKWGDNGYIKIVRGKNNCRVTSMGSYPLV